MRAPVLLLLIILGRISVSAQGPTSALIKVIQDIQAAYSKPAFLSFDIQYKYAPEESPGSYQDSLRGQVKLSGARSWYSLDSTESINTGDYQIMVFKEDRILYLTKPGSATGRAGMGANGTGTEWIRQLDSMLKSNKEIEWRLDETKAQQVIIMEMKHPQSLKRAEYYINRQTGFLDKIINIVRADQLYDPSVRQSIDAEGSYAIMETSFSNYRQNSFDSDLFNSGRYFKKQGDQYICVGAYETYKVFLGSSGL